MTNIDLHSDIEEARNSLQSHVERLLGLLSLWHMFKAAKIIADEFYDQFDGLNYKLRMACTQSLVVSYCKPWSGNRNPVVANLVSTCNRVRSISFLNEIEAAPEHNELLELRNKVVAHLDDGYEAGAVTLKGSIISNAPVGRERQQGTLEDVFLPTHPVVAGIRGFWWIEHKDKLRVICEQIDAALQRTEQEIHSEAEAFRDASLDHMHVLKHLTDLFHIEDCPVVDGNASVKRYTESQHSLNLSNPEEPRVGEGSLQSLITVYEPMPKQVENADIAGKGYRLKTGQLMGNGRLSYNVIFPQYPYPKEPLDS